MAFQQIVTMPNFRFGLIKRAMGPLAALSVLFICLVSGALGQDNLPEILELNPVPELQLLPYFDVTGHIDDIQGDWLIVNDTLVPNEDGVPAEYVRASDRTELTRSSFRVGDYVGVEQTGAMGLKRLWKLDKPLE